MNEYEYINNAIARETAYAEGYEAGKQAALLRVQAELANIAVESPANRNESRLENLVIMWSDVDKVIYKMLENK